jgi:hypothetical protein
VQQHHDAGSENYARDDNPQNRMAEVAQKRGNKADERSQERLSLLNNQKDNCSQ